MSCLLRGITVKFQPVSQWDTVNFYSLVSVREDSGSQYYSEIKRTEGHELPVFISIRPSQNVLVSLDTLDLSFRSYTGKF